MDKLVKSLKSKGVLKTPAAARAFGAVDRALFMPRNLSKFAYVDEAFPISEGQTISQPYTVAFMLDLLRPKAGDKILEVGFGSGWQTTLLAEIVGSEGRIYAMELLPRLCKLGQKNLSQYPRLFDRVELYCRNAVNGLPDIAAKIGGFEGIIAAAEVAEVPPAWRDQLKVDGTMVYPQNRALIREIKKSATEFDREIYPGFLFVPFVSGDA